MVAGRVVRGTNATVRAIKAGGRLQPVDQGLVALVQETAHAIEGAQKEGAPAYAIAKLTTVHLQALLALLRRYPPEPVKEDALTELEAAWRADPW